MVVEVVVVVLVLVAGLAVVLEVVLVEGVVDGTCPTGLDFVLVPPMGLAAVSFALLWPKLAASLPLISVTAPDSTERTVTNLIRPRFVAVGVDLITLRRIRCCSAWVDEAMRAKATLR